MALFIPSATIIPDISYIISCVSIIIGTTAIQVIREICFTKWSVGGSEEFVQFLVLVEVQRYFLEKAGDPRTSVWILCAVGKAVRTWMRGAQWSASQADHQK